MMKETGHIASLWLYMYSYNFAQPRAIIRMHDVIHMERVKSRDNIIMVIKTGWEGLYGRQR